jgi:hypothetical protein
VPPANALLAANMPATSPGPLLGNSLALCEEEFEEPLELDVEELPLEPELELPLDGFPCSSLAPLSDLLDEPSGGAVWVVAVVLALFS